METLVIYIQHLESTNLDAKHGRISESDALTGKLSYLRIILGIKKREYYAMIERISHLDFK